MSELRLLRDGLADALAGRAQLQVVATAGDAQRALDELRAHAPDVLLLDMTLRDSLALVRAIGAQGLPVHVVALAVTDAEGELVACIEAGVTGYIARDGTLDDVVAAVHSVRRGETLCSPRLAASLFRRLAALERERRAATPAAPYAAPGAPGAPLTRREREILALVNEGLANKEIARRLGIELATVKNHVHRILEKLKVRRRGQAAAQARTLLLQ